MNFSIKKNTALNAIKKRKIKILLEEPMNNKCFECSKMNPEYISLNNGIFLCKNCIANHLNFPKTISNIIKNNLNTLTINDIQYLCCGGNQKLLDFINTEYPNLKRVSPEYLYQTNAMDYYRKWLEYLIEGGIKPIKPDMDTAYELIRIRHNSKPDEAINNNFSKIKSESYMKIFKNRYPKIKPIVGSKNSFRYTKSLERVNKNLNLTTIGNYNSSLDNDDYYNYSNHKTITTVFRKRLFSSQFQNKFDTDDINSEKNNITDINEITENHDEINDNNKYEKIKIKNRINKKNKLDTNLKVLRNINNISYNNIRNTIYSKPIYQNYLNSFNNVNFLNLNKNGYKINQTETRPQLNSSIDNLKKYWTNNRNTDKNIFNLKQMNNAKEYQDEKKLNINNINNNIIINKNLNIYYNNNLQRIFKKKTIGNSFSINERNQKLNSINNSIDKNVFFMNSNLFNIKNKYKKDIIVKENEIGNDYCIQTAKIKVNRLFKNKNLNERNNINNVITENKYLKFDNEKEENIITIKQKSKIIQRINRVLKNQKDKEQKRKSTEKIKVNQKEKEKNNNQNINDKTPNGENQKINDKTPKGDDILKEKRRNNTLCIKDLINIPSSKKRNILDLIKSNNLSNKLISPDSKRLLQIHTDPKKFYKNELNTKTSVREMYKMKKNNI